MRYFSVIVEIESHSVLKEVLSSLQFFFNHFLYIVLQDKLFTSSPCSEYMALDMKGVPPGDPPRRPDPSAPGDHTQISVNLANEQPAMVWVIGPIILALLLSICLVLIFIIRR